VQDFLGVWQAFHSFILNFWQINIG